MKKIAAITAIAALLLLACGSDEEPLGTRGVHYWDISWSSPDTVITDLEMVGEKSGWACGYRYNAATETNDGIVLHYDGKSWTVALFLPGEIGAKLKAIDFTADNDGWVMGMRTGPMTAPLVMHYDGQAWTEVPTTGLNGGALKLMAALGPADVWASDGVMAYHYDGAVWTEFPLSRGGEVDAWVFTTPEAGWAVDYDSGYCYRWDVATMGWVLESVPVYNATSFYFIGDGSGVYADYVNMPPVTERANIYVRVPGEAPIYNRIYASGRGRYLTACDFFPPDYYFFAGPDAAFEVNKSHVKALGSVPSGELGLLRTISIAAKGNVWGVMTGGLTEGPSFIIHKK